MIDTTFNKTLQGKYLKNCSRYKRDLMLKSKARRAYCLSRYREGFSFKEIADMVGTGNECYYHCVRSMIRRALVEEERTGKWSVPRSVHDVYAEYLKEIVDL